MHSSKPNNFYPLCVVGGGLIGLIATLALASRLKDTGKKICFIAPDQAQEDSRTTAMMMPSIELLKKLDVWQDVEPLSAPLRTMRIVDGTNRLLRAPVVDFKSNEIDLDAFGYNVPNKHLAKLLREKIALQHNVSFLMGTVKSVSPSESETTLHLDNGQSVQTHLVVAADGRHSVIRRDVGIKAQSWQYDQSAIVLNFSHSLSHENISCEFHRSTGPCTQVPLPPNPESPNRSSLVWVVKRQEADSILNMDLDELSQLVERNLQSCFGKCIVEAEPACFPLSGMTAEQFGHDRTVLVGEAGHVFPPIGAQGFNLGLRDVSDLLTCLEQNGDEIDGPAAADCYNRKRQTDVRLRTASVDMLNRSLLSDFLPVQALRVLGLTALGSISPLRRLAMRQGLGGGSTPRSSGSAGK